MANYYHTQSLTIGAQLDRDNYAKGLGTGQYPMSGVDLRHIGASEHSALEDVPLNRKVSTLYAIEVVAPDGARSIYEGNQGQSLTLWLGAKVLLNNSGDVGVVVGIKDMWSGDIKRMSMSPSPDDVRQARKNTELTQEQAAQVIGATRRAWQEWEAGRRNMPSAKWELFLRKSKEATMLTLSDLIDQFGANGVIRIDAGNGSAGPMWCAWDDDLAGEIGGLEMSKVDPYDRAYDDDDNERTYKQEAVYVIGDYDSDEMYAARWINGGNGYMYRFIF